MVDKFYFIVTAVLMCFSCMWVGWSIGFEDAKKKYKKKGQ